MSIVRNIATGALSGGIIGFTFGVTIETTLYVSNIFGIFMKIGRKDFVDSGSNDDEYGTNIIFGAITSGIVIGGIAGYLEFK